MKHRLYYICCIVISLYCPLQALTVTNDAYRNTSIYGIKMGTSDQEFYGAVRQINSVSLQEYRTATFKVTEVVIDMIGSSVQLRIYNTELLSPLELAEKTAGGLPVNTVKLPNVNVPKPAQNILNAANNTNNVIVTKEYPVTTHAKTIEYMVGSRDELVSFFRAFKSRWIKNVEDEDANAQKDKKAEAEKTTNANKKPASGNKTDTSSQSLNGTLFIID
jgi:hypothetical protein